MRNLVRSERGATAIEYAIIGALIGIGLIGSLVGTKTSLSAIFGKAATQMASAGNAQSGSTANAASSYWDAKTISSVNKSASNTQFNYTDGSYAVYNNPVNNGGPSIRTYDTATRQVVWTNLDSSGKLNSFEVDTYYPNSSVYQTSIYSGTAFNTIANGQITGMTVYQNNPDGSRNTTQVNITPTASYLSQSTDNQSLIPYFSALSASH